jgi:protein-S-isoprenylcysteine O-methyltransferase Ste14
MRLIARNVLFTLIVPGTFAGMIPYLIGRPFPEPSRGPLSLLGLLVLALGTTLFVACVWQFGTKGRGTPLIVDPPKKLVAAGPYRWVRNPMYWGVLLILVGEALLYRSRAVGLYAAGFLLVVHLFVVLYEERTLAKRFGGSYLEYRQQVHRWIPRPPS